MSISVTTPGVGGLQFPTELLEVASGTKVDPNLTIGTGTTDSSQDLTQLLGLAAPEISGGDLMTMLLALRTKTEETQLATSTEQALGIKEQKETAAEERLVKLQEAIDKMKESEKSGLFGKIFGWIAAAAMVIAGAALMITGVGAGAGAAMLIGGVAMICCMAMQETGAMDKMLSGMAEAFGGGEQGRLIATIIVGICIAAVSVAAGVGGGPAAGMAVFASFAPMLLSPENLTEMGVDQEKAPWISMGIAIGLAVLTIAAGGASIAGGTSRIAAAAEQGGKAAKFAQLFSNTGKLAPFVSQFTSKVGASTQQVMQVMGHVTAGIAAASTIAGGASQIHSSVTAADAQEIQADTEEMQAFLGQLQQMFDDMTEQIEEIMQRLQESTDAVMGVLSQQDTTNRRIVAI